MSKEKEQAREKRARGGKGSFLLGSKYNYKLLPKDKNFLLLIKGIYNKPMANIILNGEK
jgi:hypothetical protein